MDETLQYLPYGKGSFARDENLFLLRLTDIDKPEAKSYVSPTQHAALHQIKDWVSNYLMCPHAGIGRSGAVCPYVPKSVKEDCIFLTVVSFDHYNQAVFYETILNYFQWFMLLAPLMGRKHVFRSIIMLIDFPEENNEVLVEKAVVDLKSDFVTQKSMLGEFHAGPPNKRGIRNPEFKPLYSPVPLLAIREMVQTDIEFLKDDSMHQSLYSKFFQGGVGAYSPSM